MQIWSARMHTCAGTHAHTHGSGFPFSLVTATILPRSCKVTTPPFPRSCSLHSPRCPAPQPLRSSEKPHSLLLWSPHTPRSLPSTVLSPTPPVWQMAAQAPFHGRRFPALPTQPCHASLLHTHQSRFYPENPYLCVLAISQHTEFCDIGPHVRLHVFWEEKHVCFCLSLHT